MNYELRHKDSILLKFSATENSNEPEIEIFWQNTELQYLLPLDLTVSEGGLSKWLKHRTIPKNRAYVHSFLSKCGMNINRPMNIIKLSKGLSVNDCYWIVEDGFDGLYDKYNLGTYCFHRLRQFYQNLFGVLSGIYYKWNAAKVLAKNIRKDHAL